MYELWGLIDDCHFLIDEIESVIVYNKHDKFNGFVNHFFDDRIVAKKAGNKGVDALDKNIMNSSYGQDIQNNENFKTVRFLSKEKAMEAVVKGTFMNSTEITEDLYLVEKDPLSADCKKPLQSGFATLSNAKYWFITFVYKFMFRCLDPERFHFLVCDTDSYMWAVADKGVRRDLIKNGILKGLSDAGKEKMMNSLITFHFEDILKDRQFYEANYDLWIPKKKKLMTLEYDHCCKTLIALAPRNYYCEGGKSKELKLKGISVKLNKGIDGDAFRKCLHENTIVPAENYALRQKNHEMTKQLIRKSGLTGIHTKMVVLPNQACLPFVYGINADNYVIEK
jgi:hypothetical protein